MRIAVTGASGSLGRALLKRLTQDGGADRLVAFSRDEAKRASLASEFGRHPGVRVCAGDVRDRERLTDLFHGCEAVVHAAARKVVNAYPDEADEMFKTNVLGTANVVEAAHRAGVGRVLLISSDKAVRAENVYGVSKAMAEHLGINANARTFPQGTRVAVIRYGNVLASRGSVVQVWRERLARGLLPELSDRRMTRFWLTLPQAVEFVVQALANLRGGEVFVPHLPAAPVTALAEAVWREAGEGEGELQVLERGIRPGGEKLHEELLSASEVLRARRRGPFYLVPPFQHDEMWDAKPWPGEPVDPGMVYRSDVWPEQLTPEGLARLLREA